MSSSHPSGLLADYGASWEEIFQELIKFSLSDQVSVGVWGDKRSVAVIRGKGCLLGKVSYSARVRGDMQLIGISWKNAHGGFDAEGKEKPLFPLQPTAKPIQVGDAICLLKEAAEPTIVRLCNSYSAIIMIQAPLTRTDGKLAEYLRQNTASPMDLVLVWDWEAIQDEEDRGYESSMESQGGLAWPEPALRADLDKATRLWSFGMLLNAMERYKDSGDRLRKAIEMYAAPRRSSGTYPDHSIGVGGDAVAQRVMGRLVNDFNDVEDQAARWNDEIPLHWAVKWGHEAMVEVLLEGGADTEAKDQEGMTQLCWAAFHGREAVVQLLLERGADIETKGFLDRTPLSRAAELGHEAVAKLLLERGADIEAKDFSRLTPLALAAEWGHESVVKLLLEGGADSKVKDSLGITPLMWAAENGHGRHKAAAEIVPRLCLTSSPPTTYIQALFL